MDPEYIVDESEPFSVSEIETQSTSNKRKSTAEAYNHFTFDKDTGKYACNYCSRLLVGGKKSGTHGLNGHLKICREKKRITGNDEATSGQIVFNQQNSRRKLAKMIIAHEYPLSMVEHYHFKDFCESLQPSFKTVSRNTIKRDIVKIFEHEREKTMALLSSNNSRIAITTDMWTSNNQKRGFMAITSHYIDDQWALNSRLVRFIYVPCPHTASVLSHALMDCLEQWNIDDKISALTLDNCSTNDAIIDEIYRVLSLSTDLFEKNLLHVRCCAHILNIIVKFGLEPIADSIERVRSSVAYWSATQKREEKFFDMVKSLGIKSTKKLSLDCKTRWNSTFLMLETAFPYKDVFSRLKQRDRDYNNVPTEQDWAFTKTVSEKLEVFYHMTSLFSGSKYPTSNLFFPNVCKIKTRIKEWLNAPEDVIKKMAENMSLKFDKYWASVHGIMAIAVILDPRYKMELIEFNFASMYPFDHKNRVADIRKVLDDMVDHYESSLQSSQQSSQSSFSASSRPLALEDDDRAFEQFVATKNKKDVKSELDTYLEEKLHERVNEFDILNWWKTSGMKYPILQRMARDILAIPVSSVASESAFSTGGRIVSPHRSRLHSHTLEALMCARDWILNEMKAQGIDPKELKTIDEDEDLVSDGLHIENSSLYD